MKERAFSCISDLVTCVPNGMSSLIVFIILYSARGVGWRCLGMVILIRFVGLCLVLAGDVTDLPDST